MTVRRLLISLSLCVAGAASSTPLPAYAQAQQGEIRGHLRDSAGQPLAGMRVSVLPAAGDVPLAIAASDRSGAYDLPHIPFGEYRLVVDRPGIRAQRISLHVPLLDMDAAPSTDAPAALAALHTAGQPADTTWPNKEEQDQSARPVFQAAGMHGTTAPSGYSAGASEEDMAELQQDVSSLLPVAGSLASQPIPDCGDAAALRATLAHAPTDFNAQYRLGRFYLAQQNFPLAVDHLSIASRLRPQAADVSQALTLALLGAGRTTEAEQALAEAMRLHPRTASLLLLSAQVRGARGDRAGSRLAYLDASHADPTVDEIYAAGMGLEQLGDRDDALEVVNRGLQRQPHAAALHTALGILLALERRKSDAAQALLTALDEDPEFTPAYHTLAQLVRVSYETDRAIAERTRRYVDSHPRNADVLYDDAWIRWKMNGDPAGTPSDEAIASELRLALSLNPSLAEAHFLLGTLYSDTGQPALAASEFHRVLELDPHRAQALYHLALADRRLGHLEASQEEMKRFLHMQSEGTPDSSRLSSPAAIDIRRGISPAPCPGGITSSPTHP